MFNKFRLQHIRNKKYFKISENIVSKESFTKKKSKTKRTTKTML